MEFVSDPPKMCSVDCIYIYIYILLLLYIYIIYIYIYMCVCVLVSNMKIPLDDPHWGPNRPKTWIAGSTSLGESDLAGDIWRYFGIFLGISLGTATDSWVGFVLLKYWPKQTNHCSRMVPPSDVCWFINPINYSYIYHKPEWNWSYLHQLS